MSSVPFSRLILVEPSIEGRTGHHLEYALHVLRAAAEAGCEPLLATNRRFPAESGLPFAKYRQYKYGFWSQPLVTGFGPMRWLYGKLRRVGRVGGPSDSRARRTEFHSVSGRSVTTSNEKGRSETASYGSGGGVLRRLAGCWQRRLADPLRARQFAHDTESLVRQIGVRDDDLFFLPGAGEIELDGLAQLFARRKDAARATWHLLFRRDPPSPDVSSAAHARFLRALEHVEPECRTGHLRFYTDTDDLSREYERLASSQGRTTYQVVSESGPGRTTFQVVPESGPAGSRPCHAPHFRTLPIPHTDGGPRKPLGAGGPLHVLYLGDARREKGYQHLPEIVADLWEDCIAAGRIALTIQSNPALTADEPAIAAARRQLRTCAEKAGSAVALIDEPLVSSAYRRLLHAGDLILLPYDRQAYRWRSSGILVEALAAGIPAIVPADTWLARQLPPSAGATYASVREIPALVRRIAGDYSGYAQAAHAFAPAWRAKHNAAALLAMLASRDWD